MRRSATGGYPIHKYTSFLSPAFADEDIPVKVDRVSLYLPPAVGLRALPSIAAVKAAEFYVNPGAESDELVAEAQKLGLEPILECSIIVLGVSPAQFPD